MNAKVTTYWMFGKPIVQVMPENEVEAYLNTCRNTGTMKGYIVDAVPAEIQPRAPIFEPGEKVLVTGAVAYAVGPDPVVTGKYIVQNSKNMLLRSVWLTDITKNLG